jgi:hypothetical protein
LKDNHFPSQTKAVSHIIVQNDRREIECWEEGAIPLITRKHAEIIAYAAFVYISTEISSAFWYVNNLSKVPPQSSRAVADML